MTKPEIPTPTWGLAMALRNQLATEIGTLNPGDPLSKHHDKIERIAALLKQFPNIERETLKQRQAEDAEKALKEAAFKAGLQHERERWLEQREAAKAAGSKGVKYKAKAKPKPKPKRQDIIVLPRTTVAERRKAADKARREAGVDADRVLL
jgi:hypothetical protein